MYGRPSLRNIRLNSLETTVYSNHWDSVAIYDFMTYDIKFVFLKLIVCFTVKNTRFFNTKAT